MRAAALCGRRHYANAASFSGQYIAHKPHPMQKRVAYLIATLVVLTIVIIVAYKRGWLNRILPTAWQEKSNFVGAYGRTPEMQGCLAFDTDGEYMFHFNRCTWA